MFDINLKSSVPLYEQVYKKVSELVTSGALKPGDQIPSVRALAKQLGINPNTITKAYSCLENDDIIYSLAGRGSFIADFNVNFIQEKVLKEFDKCVNEAKNVGVTKDMLIDRIEKGEDK